MTRSPSEEPARSTKRKGTRSVSTLTPSQLARKRANDREAQRAIRARTKEHIERLERELEELKSQHSRDETVQELLRRNKALERELASLRESLGIPHSRPYSVSAYDDNIAAHTSAVPSRASSYGQTAAANEYGGTAAFGTSYLPTPEPCESWSSVGPAVSTASVPSVVSSPSSSSGHPDDYVPGYIPTSVPSSMMESSTVPPPTIPCLDGNKADYDDVESDTGYSHPHQHQHVAHTGPYMQQQPWTMYPSGSYYSQPSTL